MEVIVVAFAKELEEAEDGASEVGVVEVFFAGAIAASAQVLGFVGSFKGVQI